MNLRRAWDENAHRWIAWARAPGHDSYWKFNGERFLEIVPAPGRLTIDVGCGEGRVARDLIGAGHNVVGIDGSPTLAHACATHSRAPAVAVADAAALPLRRGAADLAVAFMSLQDVDDMTGAVAEIARVLARDGRLCLAIVHPINSAGRFAGERGDVAAPFVIEGNYLTRYLYCDEVDRDGLPMSFHSAHRPLSDYTRALEAAGFVIEALREVSETDPDERWHRIPLFLHARARLDR